MRYDVRQLDNLGGIGSGPRATNNRGDIVGIAFKPAGSNFGVAVLLTPK